MGCGASSDGGVAAANKNMEKKPAADAQAASKPTASSGDTASTRSKKSRKEKEKEKEKEKDITTTTTTTANSNEKGSEAKTADTTSTGGGDTKSQSTTADTASIKQRNEKTSADKQSGTASTKKIKSDDAKRSASPQPAAKASDKPDKAEAAAEGERDLEREAELLQQRIVEQMGGFGMIDLPAKKKKHRSTKEKEKDREKRHRDRKERKEKEKKAAEAAAAAQAQAQSQSKPSKSPTHAATSSAGANNAGLHPKERSAQAAQARKAEDEARKSQAIRREAVADGPSVSVAPSASGVSSVTTTTTQSGHNRDKSMARVGPYTAADDHSPNTTTNGPFSAPTPPNASLANTMNGAQLAAANLSLPSASAISARGMDSSIAQTGSARVPPPAQPAAPPPPPPAPKPKPKGPKSEIELLQEQFNADRFRKAQAAAKDSTATDGASTDAAGGSDGGGGGGVVSMKPTIDVRKIAAEAGLPDDSPPQSPKSGGGGGGDRLNLAGGDASSESEDDTASPAAAAAVASRRKSNDPLAASLSTGTDVRAPSPFGKRTSVGENRLSPRGIPRFNVAAASGSTTNAISGGGDMSARAAGIGVETAGGLGPGTNKFGAVNEEANSAAATVTAQKPQFLTGNDLADLDKLLDTDPTLEA